MARVPNSPTTDFTSTTLNGAINSVVETIDVNDASTMVAPCYIVIDREDNNGNATPTLREVVYVSSISTNTLTVTRGVDNSTARAHNDSALVEPMITVGFWDDFYDAFDNEHTPYDGSHDITKVAMLSGTTIQTLAGKILSSPTITSPTVDSGTFTTKLSFTSQASVANTEFAVLNSAGHISITPGASKLVKTAVLRQDDTANTYTNGSVMLTGWGYKLGAAGVDELTEDVVYGITFSQVPIVVGQFVGLLASVSNASLNSAFVSGDYQSRFQILAPTASQFTAHLIRVSKDGADPGDFSTTAIYGYNWMAVGTY